MIDVLPYLIINALLLPLLGAHLPRWHNHPHPLPLNHSLQMSGVLLPLHSELEDAFPSSACKHLLTLSLKMSSLQTLPLSLGHLPPPSPPPLLKHSPEMFGVLLPLHFELEDILLQHIPPSPGLLLPLPQPPNTHLRCLVCCSHSFLSLKTSSHIELKDVFPF